MDFHSGLAVENLPANAGDAGDEGSTLGQGEPLEKEMATHSSILPKGLQKSQTHLRN